MRRKNVYSRIIKTTGTLLAFLFFHTLVSCEKEVHINLSGTPPALVVQGEIETGLPPYVLLTNTISYFSNVDLTTLENSFIHNASVKVSTGTDTIQLIEYSIDTGSGNKFYFYTIDTAHLGNIFTGVINKSYTLTINYGGKIYTATTKIPNPKPVDTIWAAKPMFAGSQTPLTARQLYFNYTDPDTLGDYVRYFTKRNSQPYYPGDQVYTDEIINGTTITQIAFDLGYNNAKNINLDSARYAFPGDTITLKWCMIDKGVYTFWNTEEFAAASTGDPFASPINVTSNISNGALGIWAGYSPTYRTIIVH